MDRVHAQCRRSRGQALPRDRWQRRSQLRRGRVRERRRPSRRFRREEPQAWSVFAPRLQGRPQDRPRAAPWQYAAPHAP